MRVSVLSDDPGYVANADDRAAYLITLNGVIIEDVITADDEVGYISRYRRDAKGNFILAPNKQEVETFTQVGKVRIEKKV